MPWFKVDDTLAWHEKAVIAGNAAMGLWVRAGSWSSQQLTEGFVPEHMAKALGSPAEASRLVAARLWDRVDGGYQFHEFLERNPSRDQVESRRRADAARQAVMRSPQLRAAVRERDGDRCRYCGAAVQWTDRRSALGGTYDHVDPDAGSVLDNLVVACRGCNSSKGHRTPAEAGMTLLPLRALRPVSDLARSNSDLNRT